MGKTLLESAKFHKGLEMSETPFGELKLHPSALAFDIKGKAVFFEIMTESFDENQEEDHLERLINLEKLKEKYPDEPIIHHGIADCFNFLKEDDKYRKTVFENFNRFSNYPPIDIAYAILNNSDKKDVTDEVFGGEMNLHRIYPNRKAFDFDENRRVLLSK